MKTGVNMLLLLRRVIGINWLIVRLVLWSSRNACRVRKVLLSLMVLLVLLVLWLLLMMVRSLLRHCSERVGREMAIHVNSIVRPVLYVCV